MKRTFRVLDADNNAAAREIDVKQLVIAGWAGRDRAALDHHIHELAEIGVAPPSQVPLYYRSTNISLADGGDFQVLGPDSSGEVEAVLIADGDELLVAVGSDHTDRKLEAYSIAASKQICAKPVSDDAWRFADVEEYWDELVLRAWATIDGERVLYQEGPVSGLLHPRDLFEKFGGSRQLASGTVMFCGTLGVIGGIRPGEAFEAELYDPRRNRSLKMSYRVVTLPIIS